VEQKSEWKKSLWFWVGVGLLSISALWWLLLVFTAVGNHEVDIGDILIIGAITTIIPIALGILGVWRGKKLITTTVLPNETYEGKTIGDGIRGRGWFWIGFVLLSLSALLWLVIILEAVINQAVDIELIIGVIIPTALPVGLGIFVVWYGANAAPPLSVLVRWYVIIAPSMLLMFLIPGAVKSPAMWGVVIGDPIAIFGVPLAILYLAQRMGRKK
jgi:hypothetical protein